MESASQSVVSVSRHSRQVAISRNHLTNGQIVKASDDPTIFDSQSVKARNVSKNTSLPLSSMHIND